MEPQVADETVDVVVVVDLRVGGEVTEILIEPIEGVEDI
jgi:hypothetical protein